MILLILVKALDQLEIAWKMNRPVQREEQVINQLK